jgi:hypothetical protein
VTAPTNMHCGRQDMSASPVPSWPVKAKTANRSCAGLF